MIHFLEYIWGNGTPNSDTFGMVVVQFWATPSNFNKDIYVL